MRINSPNSMKQQKRSQSMSTITLFTEEEIQEIYNGLIQHQEIVKEVLFDTPYYFGRCHYSNGNDAEETKSIFFIPILQLFLNNVWTANKIAFAYKYNLDICLSESFLQEDTTNNNDTYCPKDISGKMFNLLDNCYANEGQIWLATEVQEAFAAIEKRLNEEKPLIEEQEGFTGSKYKETENLTTTQIAKLIRAEIKAKKKSGELPNAKISVRTQYFANGSSIDIEIKNTPFNPINPEYIKDEKIDPSLCNPSEYYTKEGKELRDKLEAIKDQYNYDNSDSMTDYFHVRFYGHVNYDGDFIRECRNEIEQQLEEEADQKLIEPEIIEPEVIEEPKIKKNNISDKNENRNTNTTLSNYDDDQLIQELKSRGVRIEIIPIITNEDDNIRLLEMNE